VCNAGYRMGHAAVDLRVFGDLHRKQGLNVLIPVFPLHGPRRVSRLSGEGYLSFDVLDTIHAAAQTVWDVRRLIGWLRREGAPGVGVMGYSLGGYGLSLTACFEAGLACVIAGIPLTDLSRMFWRHGPSLQLAYLTEVHVAAEDIDNLLRVVSPLVLEPLAPREVLTIFGGVADRLVPPDQVRDLALHWDPARLVWSQGAHITTPMDPAVIGAIHDTLRDAKLIA
jgi:dienelactone hydrolase